MLCPCTPFFTPFLPFSSHLGSRSPPQVLQEVLSRGGTVLMVAHNLKSVVTADRIIFIEKGEVVEEGTHLELMALRGRYHHFYQNCNSLQSRPDAWGRRSTDGYACFRCDVLLSLSFDLHRTFRQKGVPWTSSPQVRGLWWTGPEWCVWFLFQLCVRSLSLKVLHHLHVQRTETTRCSASKE